MSKARLWVISELYYPEETSTGYYLTRIAEALTDEFEVMAVSGQPNYSARGTIAPKREERNGVRIFRVAGSRLDKNVIFYRLVNMFTLSTTILFLLARKLERHDKVLVVTNPPAMPFVAAAASLLRGAGYTLLIHDNYPEILVAAGKISENSLIARILTIFNRWLYKHAERIIVVGRDMLELVGKKSAGLDVPIAVIPNWAELESVEPMPRETNRLLEELELKEKFIMLYAGNMGPPNDIESVIGAADLLRNEKRFHFVFLGSGMKKRLAQNKVRKLSLSNVTFLEPRPRSEQKDFLNGCDVALISLVPKMLGVSMPSRTYNILAAGKPMIGITEDGSELARVIEEESVGWIVPPGDAHGLVKAIREAVEDVDLKEKGLRARRAAESKYSIDVAIERYRSALL
ncbi:MAG TPA: glycosyltransferase family 4 protein [Pyrinomonadaceae bacterium]|nr:glycosyltransferase family 4 protein [Pyrinomonadaceae bacterium]